MELFNVMKTNISFKKLGIKQLRKFGLNNTSSGLFSDTNRKRSSTSLAQWIYNKNEYSS